MCAFTWWVRIGCRVAIAARVVAAMPAAGTNPVVEWNTALGLFARQQLAGLPATHAHVFTLAHAAMARALAAVPADSMAAGSANAAVAEAAFQIVAEALPSAARPFAALRDAHLATVSDASARRAGIAAGVAASKAVLTQRRGDGWPAVVPRGSAAGARLAPDLLVGAPASVAPRYRTFLLPSAAKFAPELPLWITPGGEILPVERLRHYGPFGLPADRQPELAHFWQEDQIVKWNALANVLARRPGTSLERTARFFHLLNSALADAFAAAVYWQAEYGEGRHLWVATRTVAEPWHESLPYGDDPREANRLVRTPIVLQNYPAVGAVLAGAVESVLLWYTGSDSLDLSAAAPHLPAAVRDSPSCSALARQAAGAAVLNEHATCEAGVSGYELGQKIGRYAVQRGT